MSWFGLFAPAGASPAIVAKINGEVRRVFADPEFRKNFLDRQFFDPVVGSREDLANYIKVEEPKWRKVIRDAGVKVE